MSVLKLLFKRPLWFLLPGILLLLLVPAWTVLHPGVKAHASGGFYGSTPSLSVQPSPVSPGMVLNVVGFNYPANASVKVYFQNKANGVITTTTDAGGFFNVNVTLPKTYTKSVRYYVHANSVAFSAQVLVNFSKPTISVNGLYGENLVAGAPAQISIAGFAANEAVNLSLSTMNLGTINVGTLATDSTGYVYNQLPHFPSIPAGAAATLTATGSASLLSASMAVSENAGISVQPATGAVGTKVQLNGGGFGSNESVKLLLQGITLGTTQADSWGMFSFSFQVPSTVNLSNYYNNVQAVGISSGVAANASFQIVPSVHVTPTHGVAGTVVSVYGAHFTPNSVVYFYLYNTTTASSGGSGTGGYSLGYTKANARGIFASSFTVPVGLSKGLTYYLACLDYSSGTSGQARFVAQ